MSESAGDEFLKVIKSHYVHEPTEEEERQHWNGIGGIEFYVQSNRPDVFEIEVLDSWGCAGGLDKTLGIEYSIKEGILGLSTKELWEGVTYTIHDLSVEWYRGDGWEIDDNVEYYFDELTSYIVLPQFIWQTIVNFWWFTCRGWKLREWRDKKCS